MGLLHTSLNGSDDHDTYAPCTPADLRAKGYDYWALGHIHKRTPHHEETSSPLASPALYSGNIQGRHIRETGPRGCLIVDVDDGKVSTITFHPLDVFRWELCAVDCADVEDTDEILNRVRSSLHQTIGRHGDLPLGVRISLEGSTPAHQALASHREAITAEIRSLGVIESDGRVWIEQVKFRTSYPRDQKRSLEDHGPLAELVRYLDQLPDNAEAILQLTDELKDLARKLPGELTQSPEGLRLDQPDWIRALIPDLKPMLLDRLKG